MPCVWASASVAAVFERPHHRRIAQVLGALDGALLKENNCLFGGGTAIALRYGEYRESVDIDFLVSDGGGYRNLRQLLTGPRGMAAILREGASVWTQAREPRTDQYGAGLLREAPPHTGMIWFCAMLLMLAGMGLYDVGMMRFPQALVSALLMGALGGGMAWVARRSG